MQRNMVRQRSSVASSMRGGGFPVMRAWICEAWS